MKRGVVLVSTVYSFPLKNWAWKWCLGVIDKRTQTLVLQSNFIIVSGWSGLRLFTPDIADR